MLIKVKYQEDSSITNEVMFNPLHIISIKKQDWFNPTASSFSCQYDYYIYITVNGDNDEINNIKLSYSNKEERDRIYKSLVYDWELAFERLVNYK